MSAILGEPRVSEVDAVYWAGMHAATGVFADLADLYWHLAPRVGGVRPEVAYAQAAHETGFGHFGGTDPVFSVDQTAHNWCGLKTHDGSATARFPDDPTGVVAHLQHLALYAGAGGYPLVGAVDPRHFASILATAQTVESLGGHWAPDPNYGISVVTLVAEIGAS